MIQHVAGAGDLPGVVVGVGSDIPTRPEPERFRQQFGITGPFAIYVGRIDENKGCKELFEYFRRYTRTMPGALQLVLIGKAILPVPADPRIRHLGFLSDTDKFDALAAADVLIMPSYYESLSMVALEAWAVGTPVIANARCDVLLGQCLRSNAGLYYGNAAEFGAVLDMVLDDRALAARLGRNGRQFYEQHYSWPVIERKYLDMLASLSSNPPPHRMERLPGWLARRQRSLRPAAQVLDELPSGPVIGVLA
jgi:glycosyltransferase involved in cell wall biosynthesis